MVSKQLVSLKSRVAAVTGIATLVVQLISPAIAAAEDHSRGTRTPIKHVIVIIGENRTFDHVFATYKPTNKARASTTCSRRASSTPTALLDRTFSGRPVLRHRQQRRRLSAEPSGKTRYSVLPPAARGGLDGSVSGRRNGQSRTKTGCRDDYYVFLTTGGTGLAASARSTRASQMSTNCPGAVPTDLRNPPLRRLRQQPGAPLLPDVAAARLQRGAATAAIRSGCDADLFPWVEVTVGAGSQRQAASPLTGFHRATTTGEGSTAMGFYNVQQGDVPYFKSLADNYAMSDNFHQSVNGRHRRQPHHARPRRCDLVQRRQRQPALPPPQRTVRWYRNARMRASSMKSKIRIRSRHQQLVHRGRLRRRFVSARRPVRRRLLQRLLRYHAAGRRADRGLSAVAAAARSIRNCETGHYYLLNNYNPGYFGDGTQRLHRHRNPQQHRVHDSAVDHAQHRRRADRQATSRGSTTATSGTTTSPTPTSSTTARPDRH